MAPIKYLFATSWKQTQKHSTFNTNIFLSLIHPLHLPKGFRELSSWLLSENYIGCYCRRDTVWFRQCFVQTVVRRRAVRLAETL